MEIKYGLTGSERKRQVTAIGEITGEALAYKGAPSFAYEIGGFMVDKNGTLSFDDRTDSEEVEKLINELLDRGFEAAEPEHGNRLAIELPRDDFSDEAIDNLKRLVKSKATLIKKAFGADNLPIEVSEKKISFPWFAGWPDPAEVVAYAHFIGKLAGMAKTKQRVNAAEKSVDNEKYAFRCFLLRLGFIGAEYKDARKILLKNLSGNAAFKYEAAKQNACKAVDEDE